MNILFFKNGIPFLWSIPFSVQKNSNFFTMEFYWKPLRFYRVLGVFTGFLVGFTGFNWVLLGFTGFYWVLLGFIGFHLVSLGFTGFYWVLLGFTW